MKPIKMYNGMKATLSDYLFAQVIKAIVFFLRNFNYKQKNSIQ